MCNCNEQQSFYFSNYTNTSNVNNNCGHPQTCNNCLEIIKSECIRYTGNNLSSLGILTNDNLNQILVKLNAIKSAQDTKNTNILTALNSLNERLNTEAGTSYAPFTI